jgi:TetR/AcrR family transcriptional regulator, lmrAB and yxaGH operons repressor
VDSRDAIVASAALLFQRQGYAASGLLQIVGEAAVSRGSIYFHFPQGKEQIAVEAVAVAGALIDDAITRAAVRTETAADFVTALGRGLARWLEQSDYVDGDPIATVALEQAAVSDALRAACDDVFDRWRSHIGSVLIERGVPRSSAGPLAQVVLAYQEGGLLLARTDRSTASFRAGLKMVAQLIDSAVPVAPQRRSP